MSSQLYNCPNLSFTSYKDTRGNSALGQRIAEALGIESSLKGIPLVELREGDGVISVTAHSKNRFAELVVLDSGKIVLKETNGATGQQMKTVLMTDKVERTIQSWNNQFGVAGTPQKAEVPNETVARKRVEQIVKRVLPLARNI